MLAGDDSAEARPAHDGRVAARAGEVTEAHTRILRLALAVEDSRRYWEHLHVPGALADRAHLAFEQRWFGAKSLERVRYLVGSFQARFDAYPHALAALSRWHGMDLASSRVICHWHLQLSDPLYRRFADHFLNERRARPHAQVDRNAVVRWLQAEYPDKWAEATLAQFATKLLAAALEAGLVSARDPRSLPLPKVTDRALAYLLYLLRETRFEGTLTSNPYLRSVGFDEDFLAARARTLPGVTLHRMMHLVDFQWGYADLATWAAGVLA